jgi:hypothetical protein
LDLNFLLTLLVPQNQLHQDFPSHQLSLLHLQNLLFQVFHLRQLILHFQFHLCRPLIQLILLNLSDQVDR